MTGIRTDQLPWAPDATEFLVNGPNGTARVAANHAAALLGGLIGPALQTRAQLFADLAWPAGAMGSVWGDATSSHNGVYRKSGGVGSGSWSRVGDLPPSSIGSSQLAAETSAREAAVADLDRRATPIYASRTAAVTGAPSLPTSLTQIMVREGSALVVRSRTASAVDPLFESGSPWGVVQRQDASTVARDAVVQVQNLGGTANSLTADLPSYVSSLAVGTLLNLRPTAANTGPATITIAGTSYEIRTKTGQILAGGEMAAFAPQILRVHSASQVRFVSAVSKSEIGLGSVDNTADAVKPVSIPQLKAMSAGAVIHLAQVSRSDANTYSATIPAETRLTPGAGRLYRLIPSIANTGPVILTVSATIDEATTTHTLALTMGDLSPMPPGALTVNEPVLIYQYNNSFGRVVSVPYALHGALLSRVAAIEARQFAGGGILTTANIGALGDSITAGQGGTDPLANSYPRWAANQLGCDHVNYGVGGAAMSPVNVAANQTNQINGSFSRRAATVDWSIHTHASVAYGENDWRLATPLGQLGDTTEATFYGAMHVGYQAMMAANPHLRVVLLTQGYRCISASNLTEVVSANAAGHTHDDYRAAIRAFAARWHLPVIDLRQRAGIGEANSAVYTIDGTHPTEAGRKRLGQVFAAAMQALG